MYLWNLTEKDLGLADLDQIAGHQWLSPNEDSVDQCAVATTEVLDVPATLDLRHLTVHARG